MFPTSKQTREVKVVGKVKDCVVQLARTLEKKILMSIQVVEIPDSYAPWLVLLCLTLHMRLEGIRDASSFNNTGPA